MNKKSKRLYNLYKAGKLKKSLLYLKRKKYSLLGCGTQVYAYSNPNSKYVLKLCPNSINIMKNKQINMLKHVKNLDKYFVPIKDIVYKDKYVFIYKQYKCTRFHLKNNNNINEICKFIINLVIFMIKTNIIIADLGTHNIGIYKGTYYVFDYHSIYNLDTIDKNKLIKNINKFIKYKDLHINDIDLNTLYNILKEL